MPKKVAKIVFFAVLFGVLLYAVVYFMASQGNAFEFVEQTIRHSHAIESQIGKIERVRLDPLGSYVEKSVGSDEWATMTVEVTGATKTIVLAIKAKKTNGAWTIEQAKNGEMPLALD